MSFKIGFKDENYKNKTVAKTTNSPVQVPRKSVVSVKFNTQNRTLSYYNDKFDLKVGDIVFVEGKLEEVRGIVVEVNYNFKIKLSDYKRVIAVADTNVKGELYLADYHFVTFDRDVIPFSKILGWYKASANPEEEIISSEDNCKYSLFDIEAFPVSGEIKERGFDYYMQNRVAYLSLDGEKGNAVVLGTEAYQVDFVYGDGEISNLTCDCFCNYICKHRVAVMFQLRDILDTVIKDYREMYNQSNYFAAICRNELLNTAMAFRKRGRLNIDCQN